ncbi:MAG TPA: glycosyltransferase family 4 protein [Actinomycetota bacterium]|jgi:phosphatidylinositol alpha-mannosyltransferase
MRIALACPYAWDAPGGVQVHVRQLAGRMRDRGHDVLIVAPSGAPDPSIAWAGRPVRVRINRSVAPVSPWPSSARLVRRALAGFAPDVIHAHEPLVPGASMFAARAAEVPVVATFHAYADRSPLFTLAAPILAGVWRRLVVRIAVSEAAADFVSRRFPGGAVRIIPNGVEIEPFAAAEPADLPEGRRVLFVNRLDPRKGFRVMVRALAGLLESHPDARLVVAGDGPERGAVRGVSAQVRERITMLGTVSHSDLPPYHAGCEVFCAPSVGRESFGIVLVEAMAAGLPVVATDIPGYREVVRDDVDGLLVPPSSPELTAAALARVLDDADLAKRLSSAGRARAERYAWDTVADRVEAVYREAVDG